MYTPYRFSTIFTFVLVILLTANPAYADLNIDKYYTLVSSKRVSRTEIEYTYKAEVKNTEPNAANASATVTSSSANTIIVDGDLDFGDITSGNTATSTDTFSFRQNRRFTFDPNDLTWVISESQPLELVSHEFVELRGRPGHKGLFPLFSAPNEGDAKVHAISNQNLGELVVSVVTDFGDSDFISVIDSGSTDNHDLYTDVILPSTPFKLRFKMTSKQGETITTESDLITPRTFTLSLTTIDGYNFSPGENEIVLSINNHSNINESYDVLVSAVGNYINKSLISKTVSITAGETQNLLIPITVPSSINTHTLTINAKVNRTTESIFEEARLDILTLDEPLTLKKSDRKLVINPGSCTPLDKGQQTVTIMIPGSSSLNVNNIDTNTIKIVVDKVALLDVTLADIGTASDKKCEQQKPDGKTDLLMTFDLQDLIAENSETVNKFNEIYVSLLYFTKTDMRYTHNALLVFP